MEHKPHCTASSKQPRGQAPELERKGKTPGKPGERQKVNGKEEGMEAVSISPDFNPSRARWLGRIKAPFLAGQSTRRHSGK